MDQKIPYDDYQLPVVFLPSYENPPVWIPPQDVRSIIILIINIVSIVTSLIHPFVTIY